jgi:Flp pilus assembly protein TadG
MNSWRLSRSVRRNLTASHSGQASVELAFVVTLFLVLICAAIDFGRALHTLQVMSELSRQGSNLALRGEGTSSCDSLCTSVSSLLAGSSGLDLANNGKVIITAFTETLSGGQTVGPSGGPYTLSEQTASSGGLSKTSKLGSTVGAKVSLPGAPGLQNGQYLYVTEIYYAFKPITPIGRLTIDSIGMPSILYDTAFF